jgi:hypothetical protein
VFGLHRFKLNRHLVDGTVKSIIRLNLRSTEIVKDYICTKLPTSRETIPLIRSIFHIRREGLIREVQCTTYNELYYENLASHVNIFIYDFHTNNTQINLIFITNDVKLFDYLKVHVVGFNCPSTCLQSINGHPN